MKYFHVIEICMYTARTQTCSFSRSHQERGYIYFTGHRYPLSSCFQKDESSLNMFLALLVQNTHTRTHMSVLELVFVIALPEQLHGYGERVLQPPMYNYSKV